jgi:hypothetical protein
MDVKLDALDGDEWSASHPNHFTHGKRALLPVRGWVDPRATIGEVEKKRSCFCHTLNPNCPTHSQLHYLLSCPN